MAFVFGAAVTTNRQRKKKKNSFSTSSILDTEESAIVALHDEERRLMEQLAATRNKLKVASANNNSITNTNNANKTTAKRRRSSSKNVSSTSDSLSNHHQRSKPEDPPERLSLPSVSTRVVPILSSTGEPVFEVGLNGSSTAEHILPVFRLPQVDDTANFVNRIPTELTAVQAERDQESREDDEALAASLGLSVEELVEFQMEAAERTGNKQQLRRAWESQKSLLGGGGSHLLDGPESHLRPDGLPELRLEDEQSSTFGGGSTSLKRPRPSNNTDAFGTRRTPRCLQPGSNPTREQLRGEYLIVLL
jgi:hypothetical protein